MAATPEEVGADKAKPKRGRPSKFTQAIADEICQRISEGEPLRAICRDEHLPAWQTVYEWMDRDAEFSRRVACAREAGYDVIAHQTVEILDEPPERYATEHGLRIDSGHVQWQKNRAEMRLKLLACWDPKRYGNKTTTEVSGPEGKPIETLVNVQTGPQLAAVVEAMKKHIGVTE